jgi:4-hydroxy-3-polyprenylbenzoate decarboxylase
MPRETPLSTIHLETMLTAKRAGRHDPLSCAGLLPRSRVVEDLVDFVVGRALDQLGLADALSKRWGE